MQSPQSDHWHGTTILTVRKGDTVVIGGDGQVSIGQTIVKGNAKKVRPLGKGDVIGGFAGAMGGFFMNLGAGWLPQNQGSYTTMFTIAACAYLVALLIMHLLVPRLEQAKLDDDNSAGAPAVPA